MKKLILMLTIVLAMGSAAMAQIRDTLSGNITADFTMVATTCYYLKGCVVVTNNATLTINSGTKIFGIDNAGRPGTLLIDTTGFIAAMGTASDPIVFTSAKCPNERKPGDWGGVVIAGTATNNRPGNTFIVEGPCGPLYAGGFNDMDNSGEMHYVQIHFAGRSFEADNELNSLTLAAVGRGTQLDHIQVTNGFDDGFEFFGGAVDAKYLVSFNSNDDDFDTDYGYTGRVQFGLSWKQDTSIYNNSRSHGIESDNNNDGAPFAGSPKTNPQFSNFSFFGPNFCTSGPVNPLLQSALYIRRNSAQSVRNSFVGGWATVFKMDDVSTFANATAGTLQISSNSFAGGNFISNPSGNQFCIPTISTITQWVNVGGGTNSCRQLDNLSATVPGYNGACVNTCLLTPTFQLSTTSALLTQGTNFSGWDAGFFTPVTYRGAFGNGFGADWTANWTNWCPNSTAYTCQPCPGQRASDIHKENELQIVPNPGKTTVYALFNATATGKVQIHILDKVTGQSLHSVTATVTQTGAQRIAFDVSALQLGIYLVKIFAADTIYSAQMMVK